MDRLVGFTSILLLATAALMANFTRIVESPQLMTLSMGVSALMVGLIVFVLLTLSEKMTKLMIRWVNFLPGKNFFPKLIETLLSYRKTPLVLLQCLVISVFAQIGLVFIFVSVGVSLGFDIPITAYLFVVLIGMIGLAAPIAPGGIGVGQAIFSFLFSWYLGYETTLGGIGITIFQLVLLAWGILGGVFYFLRKRPNSEKGVDKGANLTNRIVS